MSIAGTLRKARAKHNISVQLTDSDSRDCLNQRQEKLIINIINIVFIEFIETFKAGIHLIPHE